MIWDSKVSKVLMHSDLSFVLRNNAEKNALVLRNNAKKYTDTS